MLANIYEVKPAQQIQMIELLLVKKDLVFQDFGVVVKALELYRAKPSLGFSDCLILECARKAGYLPLGTFDRKLAKAAGAQLL